ncbi:MULTISPECIES: DUF3626 domain-containing protein [Pseudoalteromonas]|nr:DUF3626 domain-containing protein [Pseudoalteromonas spongiae]ATD00286.1 hypothetical protein PSPO_b0201 [Pseudoalteromonas spongiae UST010723-006]
MTINFHPDRFTNQNVPLVLVMQKAGHLQSQFEIGTSNGGLTAYAVVER